MTRRAEVATHRFVARPTPKGTLLAETRIGDAVHQCYLRGSSFASDIQRFTGQDFGASVTVSPQDSDAPEQPVDVFNGKYVLLALRVSEDRNTFDPWLRWHLARGFRTILLIDGVGDLTEADLAEHADLPGLETLISVSASVPLLTNDPRRALAEPIIYEAVRHRFLSRANLVVSIGLCDLLLPDCAAIAEEVAAKGVVDLGGQVVFPWRLRKKAPAPFHDHIYALSPRQTDQLSWAVAAERVSPEARWLPGRIHGATPGARVPDAFLHAAGVAQPGVDPKELVDKAALREDADAAALLAQAFDTAPIRRKEKPPLQPTADDTTIVTAMKNEGPFILDWIAHHRAIGVERFVVFSNDCEDGTDALLDALAVEGLVEHHANPYRKARKVPQRAAFDAAQHIETVQKSGWLMTLDVDEYLNIHAGDGRLEDLRSSCAEANVFSIPWRLFGSGDAKAFVDTPVTHQFRHCAPAFCPRPHQAWGFKTLYRNAGFFRRLGVHRPLGLAPDRLSAVHWVNGAGQPLPQRQWRKAWRVTAETWGYDLATINHYAVRSAESFLVKRHRGRVNHTGRDQSTAYWFRMNQNAEHDTSIRRMDPHVAKERAALAALPRVADLHAAAVIWHHRKIAALKTEPAYADLFAEITGEKLRKLSRMAGRFGSNVFLAGPDAVPDDIMERSLDEDWMYTITTAARKD